MRFASILSLFAMVFLVVGCSSAPRFETRSYALQNTDVEWEIINRTTSEEIVRLGDRAFDAAEQRGGKLEGATLKGDVAVVTTTPRGHSAIKKSLEESRRNADSL